MPQRSSIGVTKIKTSSQRGLVCARQEFVAVLRDCLKTSKAVIFSLSLMGMLFVDGVFANEQSYYFDIPAQRADDALIVLGQQADITVLFQYDMATHYDANRLQGDYPLPEAVAILLANSGLKPVFGVGGHLIISVDDSQEREQMNKNRIQQKKEKQIRTSFFTAISTVLLSVLTPTAVMGQTTETNSGVSASAIEEIIVTARKREESLQDTPIAISAYTGDSLEVRGITNLSEIGSITPNLNYQINPQSGGSSSAATVYMRGVGQRDFLGTIDNGVGFYIDGVYIARTVGAAVDLLDVDRIEVLRGPQGTLFGRNNVGGALLLYSQKPAEEFGGYISAGTGTDSLYRVKFSVDMPVSDTFYAKVTGLIDGQDGYVERPAGGDLGDDDTKALRTSFFWQASNDIEVDFSADYSTETVNGPAFQLAGVDVVGQFGKSFPGFYNNVTAGATCAYPGGITSTNPACYNTQYVGEVNQGTAPTYSDTTNWGARLGIEWEISDNLTLKSITAYRDLDSQFARDADASPLTIVHFFDDFQSQQVSQELQLIGNSFNGKLDWITGFYYFNEDGFNQNVLNFAIANFDSRNKFSSTSLAAFAQGTYHLTERLEITLGIRYTDEEKTFDPNQVVISSNIGIPPGTLILPLGENKRSTQEFTPMVNIAYDFTDGLMGYATYAEGFRSGGFVQRIFPPRPDVADFKPEFVTSYELGLKYNNSDGTFSLNAAGFFMDYKDIQVRVPVGVAQVEDNVGAAEVSGFELELKWQPLARWFIEASLGYTSAKYTALDINALPSVDLTDPYSVIQIDNKFDHVPELSGSASISREFSLGDYGLLVARFSGNASSSYFNEPLNLPQIKTPGVELFDATFVWTSVDERYTANFGVKNLTDEKYLKTGYFNPTIGTIEQINDRGRQWYLTGRYNF